jgi:hypothetical protein
MLPNAMRTVCAQAHGPFAIQVAIRYLGVRSGTGACEINRWMSMINEYHRRADDMESRRQSPGIPCGEFNAIKWQQQGAG